METRQGLRDARRLSYYKRTMKGGENTLLVLHVVQQM